MIVVYLKVCGLNFFQFVVVFGVKIKMNFMLLQLNEGQNEDLGIAQITEAIKVLSADILTMSRLLLVHHHSMELIK
jgi:hypothetical protein